MLRSRAVARLTSLQVWTADLADAARFYRDFIGLDLGGDPHTHEGNESLHYDLAWGDFDSGEFMILHITQAEPGQHTTGAQIGITVDDVDAVHRKAADFGIRVLHMPHDGEWGRNAVYEGPDGNIVSITSAQPRHRD